MADSFKPVDEPQDSFVPIEPSIAPAQVQSQEDSKDSLQKELDAFNPNKARTGQAIKYGVSTTLRALDAVGNRFVPKGVTAPSLEDMPYVKNLIPEKGYTPQGPVEHVVGQLASFADPAQLLVQSAVSKAAENLVSSEALTAAEGQFAAREARDTASTLLKERMKNAAAKGAIEGGLTNAYIQGADATAEGDDPVKAAKRIASGLTVGALGGAAIGAGTAGLLKRPKYTAIESFPVPETPATQALQADMDVQLSRQARFSQELSTLKQIGQTQNDKILSLYNEHVGKDSALLDDAAQQAAEIESRLSSHESTNPSNQAAQDMQHVAKKQLESISDGLDSKLSGLQSERSKLLEQAQASAGSNQAKIEGLQSKLQVNLERQQLIKDHMESMGFEAKRANKNIPEMLDVAHAQVKKVEDAASKGAINPEQAEALKHAEFQNALNVQGYKNDARPVSGFGEWLNSTEQANAIDKKYGTRTGEFVIKADIAHNKIQNFVTDEATPALESAKRLKHLGIPENDVPRLLQYFESDANGNVRFNPAPVNTPSMKRPAYYGPQIGPEVEQELRNLRRWFDGMREVSGAEKVPGYIPLMETTPVAGVGKASQRSITDASHLQERVSGQLMPEVHETNIFKMIPRYSRQVARANFLAEPLEHGIAELNKLTALGQVEAANQTKKMLLRGLGLSGEKEAGELFAGSVMKYNRDVLQKIADQMPDKASFMRDLWRETNKMAYLSLVTTKVPTLLKQVLQPELVGSAEIGSKWMAAGRSGLLNGELRDVANRLLKGTLTKDLPELAELRASQGSNALIKGIRGVNYVLENTTGRVYNAAEKANRMTSLIGSLRQARNAFEGEGISGMRKIMDNMLTSERNLIEKTYQTQGEKAAQEMYAMLRTRRINFSYNMADKPEALNNIIGRAIPFTGFSRGMANRVIGDIMEGNPVQLAARIAKPLVGIHLLGMMTGMTLPGANPTEAAADVSRARIAPLVTAPLEEFAKTKDPIKALAKGLDFTPIGAFEKAVKQYKEGGSSAERFLGVKKYDRATVNKLLRKLP